MVAPTTHQADRTICRPRGGRRAFSRCRCRPPADRACSPLRRDRPRTESADAGIAAPHLRTARRSAPHPAPALGNPALGTGLHPAEPPQPERPPSSSAVRNRPTGPTSLQHDQRRRAERASGDTPDHLSEPIWRNVSSPHRAMPSPLSTASFGPGWRRHRRLSRRSRRGAGERHARAGRPARGYRLAVARRCLHPDRVGALEGGSRLHATTPIGDGGGVMATPSIPIRSKTREAARRLFTVRSRRAAARLDRCGFGFIFLAFCFRSALRAAAAPDHQQGRFRARRSALARRASPRLAGKFTPQLRRLRPRRARRLPFGVQAAFSRDGRCGRRQPPALRRSTVGAFRNGLGTTQDGFLASLAALSRSVKSGVFMRLVAAQRISTRKMQRDADFLPGH